MSKSRWSQWVIAESTTARIPLPWDRKTRIRHRSQSTFASMRTAQQTTSNSGATA